MKKLNSKIIAILFSVTFLISNQLIAQSPEKMSYQAVVRTNNNALVVSSLIGMKISILQGSASGTPVYVETQTPTSNNNGLVSVELGNGTLVSGSFANINWSNGPFFIKSETDPLGGNNYTISGTNQLLSVPFALHAKTADSLTHEKQKLTDVLINGNNANGNNIVNTGQIGIGTTNPNSNAALEINSNTKALLLSRMTTSERDAISATEGLVIYNTSERKFQGYAKTEGIFAKSTVDLTDAYVANSDHPAQSFQLSSNIILESISFSINKFYNGFITGDVNFNLYQGLPNGTKTLLHTNTITINTLGDLSVLIPSKPSLSIGTDYFFEIVPVSNFSTGWFSVSRSNGSTPGEQVNGSIWYYNSMMGNGTYNPSSWDDLKFEVVGITEGWVNLH